MNYFKNKIEQQQVQETHKQQVQEESNQEESNQEELELEKMEDLKEFKREINSDNTKMERNYKKIFEKL